MQVYRLAREKYSNMLSGYGASVAGGRWNSKGVEIIYTAENRSLAMAEVAVHLSLATLPNDFNMLSIFIPDYLSVEELELKSLPKNWNVFPPPRTTQFIGDTFIRSFRTCLLRVPSAVTQGDFNYLINPYHKEFKKIKIFKKESFKFDDRLFFS
jgi:RES domain-containing protein